MSVIPETLINHILSFRPRHPIAKIISLQKKHHIYRIKSYIKTLSCYDEYEIVVLYLNKLNNMDIESFDMMKLQKLKDEINSNLTLIKENF